MCIFYFKVIYYHIVFVNNIAFSQREIKTHLRLCRQIEKGFGEYDETVPFAPPLFDNAPDYELETLTVLCCMCMLVEPRRTKRAHLTYVVHT